MPAKTTWTKEVDVVVVGYGSAGAVAAIVAHDCGAEALIVEKAPWPGGLSSLAGGIIKGARDKPGAAEYLRHLSGGRVEPRLVDVFAGGLMEVEGYLKTLAKVDGAEITVHEKWSGQPAGVYPFPGQDSLSVIQVGAVPDFHGFPWIQTRPISGGSRLMKVLIDNVERRKIETMMGAPARRLVVAGGAVKGIEVERDSKIERIRAKRGIILACGGFEQNQQMKLNFLQGLPFYSVAPLTHTGDGISMAQEAGAALWHMWLLHASYGFKFPDYPIAFRHSMRGWRVSTLKMRWIVVDKFGSRYMNEYHPAAQDTNARPMELYDPDLPGYPRIPSYMIFDDVARKAGPVGRVLGFGDAYHWSEDNADEVKKGWIIKSDSLEELGKAIRGMPENDSGMDPSLMEATVADWNKRVDAGKDSLGRPGGTMVRIDHAPFYAVPVWPVISNTQGGPVHNEKQQCLNSFGEPIEGLYAAGELGSFFGHIYEQGCNLSECIISGRIAGEQAAGGKKDS